MFFRRLYSFITVLASLALAGVFCLGIYASRVGKLGALEGERVFYLDSASSQGLRKEDLSLADIFRVEGESVHFERGEEKEEELVERICDMYSAKVLFSEKVDGVTSYYCYTNEWQNGLDLGGITVNLHIAVSERVCAVGTPIIFDGF